MDFSSVEESPAMLPSLQLFSVSSAI